MASNTTDDEGRICIEDVAVTLKSRFRGKKLEIVIAAGRSADSAHSYSSNYEKDQEIRYRPMLLCPLSTVIKFTVYRVYPVWTKVFASMEVSLDAVRELLIKGDQKMKIILKVSLSTELREQDVRAILRSARTNIDAMPVIFEKLGRARDVVKLIKNLGDVIGDVHPVAKAAFFALEKLYDACEQQEACRDGASELLERIGLFLLVIEHANFLKELESCRHAVKRMFELIVEVSSYITQHPSSSHFKNLISSTYSRHIDKLNKKLGYVKTSYDMAVQAEMLRTLLSEEQDRQLQKLKPATDAYFKASAAHMCLEGTRTDLLEAGEHWICGSEDEYIEMAYAEMMVMEAVWLHGLAGSGKTFIANTVAGIAHRRGLCVACFFCKRDSLELSSPTKVLPTIAYWIARKLRRYREAVMNLLRGHDGPTVLTGDVNTQFKLLFEDQSHCFSSEKPLVIVIDALDECGDSPLARKELALCILKLTEVIPQVRIFVTSRPEIEIKAVFERDRSKCLPVDINSTADIDADIRFYSARHLAELKIELSEGDLNKLVGKAAGLFIWCSTLFKYLKAALNPSSVIHNFLSDDTRRNTFDHLYGLYDRIVDEAAAHEDDMTVVRAILGVVYITSFRLPLSSKAVSSLLQKSNRFNDGSEESVRSTIAKLHAVLFEDHSMGGVVRAYHPSFLDFLQIRLETTPGWPRPPVIHGLLFDGSMSVLLRELRFNIAGLEDSSLLNRDVPGLKERVKEVVSEELRYSCLFWMGHFKVSQVSAESAGIQAKVSQLVCSMKAIYLIEALSLMDVAEQSVAMFRSCASYFKNSSEIMLASFDLIKLVSSSMDAMASTPHLYLTALSRLPKNSYIAKEVLPQTKFRSLLLGGVQENWDAVLWAKHVNHRYTVCSPDRRRFMVLSESQIFVYDVGTGKTLTIIDTDGGVETAAYSPSGKLIASVSHEKISIWDAETGLSVGTALHGGIGFSPRLAFSHDSTRLISILDDSMQVWDVETCTEITLPRQLPSKSGYAALSPDDQHLLTADQHKNSICIWDIQADAVLEPLVGHTSRVGHLSYSPDGFRILSLSDSELIIWDARTFEERARISGDINKPVWFPNSEYILLTLKYRPCIAHAITGSIETLPTPREYDWFYPVAVSPDGKRVAALALDGAIHLWDAQSRNLIAEPLRWHFGKMDFVAFSHDYQRILVASRKTILLADVSMEALQRENQRTVKCDEFYRSAKYSPDGTLFALVTKSGIQLRDAETGRVLRVCVNSKWAGMVAFAPNGKRLASRIGGAIVYWNIATGLQEGHGSQVTGRIWCLAFSPDSKRIAYGTTDGSAYITDDATILLHGHSKWVNSIAFSPDGRRVVTSSDDDSARQWDAKTGETLGVLRKCGHIRRRGWRLCCFYRTCKRMGAAAYSPNGQYLAIGSAGGIYICNTETGVPVRRLKLSGASHMEWSYSHDGTRIASSDGRIWDVSSGDVIQKLSLDGPVTSLSFSPDDRCILASTDEGETFTLFVDSDQREWNKYCSGLFSTNGWAQDATGKLFFWIRPEHRDRISRGFALYIADGASDVLQPRVDFSRLKKLAGRGWTKIMDGE